MLAFADMAAQLQRLFECEKAWRAISGRSRLPLTNIFNLPDGFTVNDPDMFILNNNFVTPVAGVPEPSTWVMLLLGFAALGYMGIGQSRVRAIVA